MMHIELLNYDNLSFDFMYFSMIYCFFPFILIWKVKLWLNYDRLINVQILKLWGIWLLKHFNTNSWKPKKWKQNKKNKKITHTKIYKTCCNYINKQATHHPTSKHLWQFLFLEKLVPFQKVSLLWSKGKICAPSLEDFPNT